MHAVQRTNLDILKVHKLLNGQRSLCKRASNHIFLGRERSVGRVDVSDWEARMAMAKDKSVPPKTPPQKRRQMKPPCSSPQGGPRDEIRSPTPPFPAPPPPPRNMRLVPDIKNMLLINSQH